MLHFLQRKISLDFSKKHERVDNLVKEDHILNSVNFLDSKYRMIHIFVKKKAQMPVRAANSKQAAVFLPWTEYWHFVLYCIGRHPPKAEYVDKMGQPQEMVYTLGSHLSDTDQVWGLKQAYNYIFLGLYSQKHWVSRHFLQGSLYLQFYCT